jgi:hypothetical protein
MSMTEGANISNTQVKRASEHTSDLLALTLIEIKNVKTIEQLVLQIPH